MGYLICKALPSLQSEMKQVKMVSLQSFISTDPKTSIMAIFSIRVDLKKNLSQPLPSLAQSPHRKKSKELQYQASLNLLERQTNVFTIHRPQIQTFSCQMKTPHLDQAQDNKMLIFRDIPKEFRRLLVPLVEEPVKVVSKIRIAVLQAVIGPGLQVPTNLDFLEYLSMISTYSN